MLPAGGLSLSTSTSASGRSDGMFDNSGFSVNTGGSLSTEKLLIIGVAVIAAMYLFKRG